MRRIDTQCTPGWQKERKGLIALIAHKALFFNGPVNRLKGAAIYKI
jgi:hypothetical protein